MDAFQIGHFLRLRKLGAFAHRSADPEAAAPREARASLPSGASDHRPGPDGTWSATTDEPGGKVLHWIAGGRSGSVPGLPPFADVAFDLPSGRAWLTAEGGEILELDLAGGSTRPVRASGFAMGQGARLTRIFLLTGERVLVRQADVPSRALVFRAGAGEWDLEQAFPFHGDFVVVAGRALVGGAGALHVLVVDPSGPRSLASVPNHGGQSFFPHRGRARFYGPHGGWELSGLEEALAAVDSGALPTSPFVG